VSWVTELARPDIVGLKPYEHAAWLPTIERLHANELPWRASGDQSQAGLNRYPEPQPRELIQQLAALYEVDAPCVLAGRGSDEAIDLLTRAFCRAGQDSVLICPPTFGMYSVAARIQGADVVTVPLLAEQGFAIDEPALLDQCTPNVKLVYICSPNNPTGNAIDEQVILRIARRLAGRALVVVDEAYIEFADVKSVARHIAAVPNLTVMRTLSKAHGLAGARCGTLIAIPEIIALLRKIIPPYAISQMTVETVVALLQPAPRAAMRERIALIISERARVAAALRKSAHVTRVWPSDANFLLVEFKDAGAARERAYATNLLIRDVRAQPGLSQSLRITIGSVEQNTRLLEAIG